MERAKPMQPKTKLVASVAANLIRVVILDLLAPMNADDLRYVAHQR
jgi:hypothetical protein